MEDHVSSKCTSRQNRYLKSSILTFQTNTVIHDDIVLTAGHCLQNTKDTKSDVYIGGHASGTGERRSILDHSFHPRYDFENFKAYDFLLLKLNRPIDNPQLIQLNSDPHYPAAGSTESFKVIGFGHTREDGRNADHLQEVAVPHIPDCSPFYENVNRDIAFCSGHKQGQQDSCQADSGGALFHPQTQVQVGMVSWGRGCARRNAPGVYARVSAAYSWIHHQICELSEVPPTYCVTLRVEITMDNHPEEVEWALLDNHSQEMVIQKRGSISKTGLTTTILRVPAGSYRFYMNDVDGICCNYGRGGIAIYRGESNEELLRHDGVFLKDIILDLTVPSPLPAAVSTSAPDTTSTLHPDLTIPATISVISESSSTISSSALEIMKSTLRVEIFHDTHPTETGWFLVNKDSNDELFSSTYDSNNTIPANRDKAMTLVIQEFDDLKAGNYWFVIADAAKNGICCSLGEGYVRIVQVVFFESSPTPGIGVQQQRDEGDIILEERVLWEHNGTFSAFAEAHFLI